jgi:hypothetical protein
MMFIVRGAASAPNVAAVQVKLTRQTPAIVFGGAGKTDHFCVGDPEAVAALRVDGWEIVELRDGWYADDSGGGVAISGQGKYWEVRDTPFTVKEAVGPGGDASSATDGADEQVNVRREIFGV